MEYTKGHLIRGYGTRKMVTANNLGVRIRLFLGEDENGEYLGDPPTIFVNLCLHCYDWSVNVDDYIPNEPSEIKRVEGVGKTFEEIFAEGEKWERDTECAEVFEHSDYKCDSCDEVLIEGAIVQW